MNGQPENIGITTELKQSVRSAHAAYKARLEKEKQKEEKKRAAAEQNKKEAETNRKAKEEMFKSVQSLEKRKK